MPDKDSPSFGDFDEGYNSVLDAIADADDSDYGPDDGLDDYSRNNGGMYCKHGTYLGTPGGADLMCGMCEAE